METEPVKTQQTVFTLTARCRDCYRCVRACPVKAIRMEKGQAFVVEERCIACGTCIRECPQKAKMFRNDLEKARRIVRENPFTAVSLAPSFAPLFPPWQRKRLVSALRKIGFSYVGETSIGAYPVARASFESMKTREGLSSVCTACPAVAEYVQKYRPELADRLVPVVSPMIAHAKMIREKHPNRCKVIFIGPCVAKKKEAEKEENQGIVDAVLTFTELREWLDAERIDLSQCEESDFDEEPYGEARFFPLPGGLLKTAGMDTSGMNLEVFQTSGFQALKESMELIKEEEGTLLLEPLFCPEGCINGPGIQNDLSVFARKKEAILYAAEAREKSKQKAPPKVNLSLLKGSYPARGIRDSLPPITEEDLQRVLKQTGKTDPAHELNCGACGYETCREKAAAVVDGMAEPEMCIPYMRRLAEQRTDKIIETSPNGILILDKSLNILSMNPAFRKFFLTSDPVLGKHVSYLMDPAPFEKLVSGVADQVEITMKHPSYNLTCHELFYALREEQQYVGIFMDITRLLENQSSLEAMKEKTVLQAREILEHQIRTAQKIAQFLGENTAQSEDLVKKLMAMTDAKETNDPGRPGL